jgi:hypothetical protein
MTLSETLKTESVKNKTDKRNDEANNNSESNEQQLTQVDDSKKFEELMIDLDSQKKETENLKSVIQSSVLFSSFLNIYKEFIKWDVS